MAYCFQVFDSNGNFTKEFGSYGNGEGEFDCLAGVAVNRIGQFIIADRYNHRIQASNNLDFVTRRDRVYLCVWGGVQCAYVQIIKR